MVFLIIFTLIILCFFILLAYNNTKDIQVNHVKINTSPNSEKSTSISILHLSDLHLENISISPIDLLNNITNQQIDLIALTGDFLDRKRSIPKLIPYLKVLNRVHPKYGIYAVLGNHDYVLKDEDLDQLKEILKQNNCILLQNSNDQITVENQTINIIGIDDHSTNRSDLEKSYDGIKPSINLVLTHDPNIVLDMDDYEFDYLLAGHFHGGQICYPKAYHLVKMGKLAQKNIIKGLHNFEKSPPFYISEGLGQTGVNIRIGSRPEITFHQVFFPIPYLVSN